MTRLQSKIEEVRRKSGDEGVRRALMNCSWKPGGEKRTREPRSSIWPADKVARPGRMG